MLLYQTNAAVLQYHHHHQHQQQQQHQRDAAAHCRGLVLKKAQHAQQRFGLHAHDKAQHMRHATLQDSSPGDTASQQKAQTGVFWTPDACKS